MSIHINNSLIVFSGLPGTGKTTLAKRLAHDISAAYFRLDTIEQGLREVCTIKVQGEGYRLTHRITKENLLIGNNVIIDCCNPWSLTRREWQEISREINVKHVDIEITCNNKEIHKSRVESRKPDIKNFILPSWSEIESRKYEPWENFRIAIDTSDKSEDESYIELLEKIGYYY